MTPTGRAHAMLQRKGKKPKGERWILISIATLQMNSFSTCSSILSFSFLLVVVPNKPLNAWGHIQAHANMMASAKRVSGLFYVLVVPYEGV